mmetsp:Transcript_67914/g.159871  ORF Transcript_67914/g.159871 Transcript_67914/m.159871 type:complete len:92 (+) Transcript_67914:56-331(+)
MFEFAGLSHIPAHTAIMDADMRALRTAAALGLEPPSGIVRRLRDRTVITSGGRIPVVTPSARRPREPDAEETGKTEVNQQSATSPSPTRDF